MIAETYLELLTDIPHWMFELTVEAVTFALGVAWGWARVKRHIHDDISEAEQRITAHLEDDMDAVDRAKERHQG